MCLLMEGWGMDMDKQLVYTLYVCVYLIHSIQSSHSIHTYTIMYIVHTYVYNLYSSSYILMYICVLSTYLLILMYVYVHNIICV